MTDKLHLSFDYFIIDINWAHNKNASWKCFLPCFVPSISSYSVIFTWHCVLFCFIDHQTIIYPDTCVWFVKRTETWIIAFTKHFSWWSNRHRKLHRTSTFFEMWNLRPRNTMLTMELEMWLTFSISFRWNKIRSESWRGKYHHLSTSSREKTAFRCQKIKFGEKVSLSQHSHAEHTFELGPFFVP